MQFSHNNNIMSGVYTKSNQISININIATILFTIVQLLTVSSEQQAICCSATSTYLVCTSKLENLHVQAGGELVIGSGGTKSTRSGWLVIKL